MSEQPLLSYELHGRVAVITMNDGKANALSHAMLDALSDARRRAADEARALVLAGREGRFCAGFDLRVMTSGAEAVRELVRHGGEVILDLYEHPQPVVLATTGHALAGGAFILATGDVRVGARGAFKIGLNEVRSGMPVPMLGVELARARLTPRAFHESVLFSKIYDPQGAADVGWLDQLVDPDEVVETALGVATGLAKLPRASFAQTKARMRRDLAQRCRAALVEDLATITGLQAP